MELSIKTIFLIQMKFFIKQFKTYNTLMFYLFRSGTDLQKPKFHRFFVIF